MTSAQAPRATEAGSGRVVDAVYQTTTTSTQNVPQHKRTTLLSTLSAGERKAFLQEQLDQSAIFRQIACAKNGVTGPVERNLIGDEPTQQEIREESTRVGLSEQEVRRREEIARREAMIEVREEVMRRQEEALVQQASEDAARRQAEHENALAQAAAAAKQAEAAAKQAEAETANKKKTAPVLMQPPLRPQPIVAAPVGISEADAQRREDLARKEAEIAAREEALRNKIAIDQIRNQTGGNHHEPVGSQPVPTDLTKPFWTTAKVATATGLGTAAAAGLATWALTSGGFPSGIGNTPPAVNQPADAATNTDRETLLLLESQGLSAPRTPLGAKILEAFEKDPSLRERVMQDVEQTLLAK